MPREPHFKFVKTPEHLALEAEGQRRVEAMHAYWETPEGKERIAAAQEAQPPFPPGPEVLAPEPDKEALLKVADRIRKAGRYNVDGQEVRIRKFKISKENSVVTDLKNARKKVLALAAVVRDQAFEDWLAKWTVPAKLPTEWTQASELYQNYLKRAPEFGHNQSEKRISREELATETQWGRMMGGLHQKRRKAGGNYYPVRLKRGA